MNQITEPAARARANAVLQEARDKLEEIMRGGEASQAPAQQSPAEQQS
jgi:hypothetical protein